MAVVGTFNVSGAAIRRPSSIEDKIWDGEGTLISATMVRKLGAGRGVPQQTRTSGNGRADDNKAESIQTYFWVRNAPYALKDLDNPLKSQQMRPPSERTIRGIYICHRARGEALLIGSARVNLGFLDVDPTQNGREPMSGFAVVGRTGRGSFTEPMG